MERPPETLVCFAVKEEADCFMRLTAKQPHLRTLLTGMGKGNAERAIRGALETRRPARVWSCGFAGGLGPELQTGTLLFSDVEEPDAQAALLAAGARPGRFHCADKVAVTASSKRALREGTGADAVEMESQIIARVCREKGIPCATVRVILDAANEDLPLDFNALMTDDQRLDPFKLAWTLAKSPRKIGALLRLQKQSQAAAKHLGEVLARVLRG